MTKEEKIKEVYLELYNSKKHLIDAYGWFNNSNENDAVTMGETNFLGECDYKNEYWFRPKSLSGIENNLGWIKIESEADLPKKELDCHFIFKQNDKKYQTFGVWDNKLKSFCSGTLRINYVTYYQPIKKPEPPIY